mmetsp:Transcript_96582/g.268458  ORF Transcript_96582/g.268458 Transcript_96582/m.268458 type:complete len:300 (-) Transcript_96582:206-1105(-)
MLGDPSAHGPAPWFAAVNQEDGILEMIMYFACWTASWVVLFYALSATAPLWMRGFPTSSKEHENTRYWCARNVIGIVHALFISALTVPAFFMLSNAPDEIRFGATGHLATCSVGSERLDAAEWEFVCQAVAMAGLAFTAFTLADVGISGLHGLVTPDLLVHHVAFISAGLIIRGHCMLPLNAAILLAMEASTPFLNLMLFFRRRGDSFKSMVQANGIAFVVLFIVFRLILNTYGAVVLWQQSRMAMPPTVSTWEAWFLLIAVAAGAIIQFFWFPQIARTFSSGICELLGQGATAASGTN